MENQGTSTSRQITVTTEGKRGRRSRVITVTYENEMIPGAFEKALTDIFIQKVKDGTLDIRDL